MTIRVYQLDEIVKSLDLPIRKRFSARKSEAKNTLKLSEDEAKIWAMHRVPEVLAAYQTFEFDEAELQKAFAHHDSLPSTGTQDVATVINFPRVDFRVARVDQENSYTTPASDPKGQEQEESRVDFRVDPDARVDFRVARVDQENSYTTPVSVGMPRKLGWFRVDYKPAAQSMPLGDWTKALGCIALIGFATFYLTRATITVYGGAQAFGPIAAWLMEIFPLSFLFLKMPKLVRWALVCAYLAAGIYTLDSARTSDVAKASSGSYESNPEYVRLKSEYERKQVDLGKIDPARFRTAYGNVSRKIEKIKEDLKTIESQSSSTLSAKAEVKKVEAIFYVRILLFIGAVVCAHCLASGQWCVRTA